MKTTLLLATSLLLAGVAALPTTTATHDSSCTTSPGGTCSFACHAGERLVVLAEDDDGYTWGQASCANAYIGCVAVARCTFPSESAANYDAAGICVGYDGTVATCYAGRDHSRTVGGGPVSTPGSEGGPVFTPGVGKTCAPEGILCVGPIDPVFLADSPPVSSVPLLPAWSVTVDLIDRSADPRVEEEEVGPITVLGPPVPVTLCDTPCALLLPSAGHTPYLVVTLWLGSAGSSYPILT